MIIRKLRPLPKNLHVGIKISDGASKVLDFKMSEIVAYLEGDIIDGSGELAEDVEAWVYVRRKGSSKFDFIEEEEVMIPLPSMLICPLVPSCLVFGLTQIVDTLQGLRSKSLWTPKAGFPAQLRPA